MSLNAINNFAGQLDDALFEKITAFNNPLKQNTIAIFNLEKEKN